MINRTCDFNPEDLDDAARDTRDSFLINNKRVWLNRKPDFLESLDRKMRFENHIPDDSKCIVSIFLPIGGLWPIDFEVKKDKFETTILIPTISIHDLNKNITLAGMRSYVMYPKKVIYNFKVRGCMIMLDYINDKWVEEREHEKQKVEQQIKEALEALS